MTNRIATKTVLQRAVLAAAYMALFGAAPAYSQGMIIDHTCTDLSQVPAAWISAAQNNYRVHYAHRSHGSQITVGLELIEGNNSAYSAAVGVQSLPSEAGALCIYTGVPSTDYPYPEDYFGEVQGLLNNRPTINVSMFSWCDEMESWSAAQVNDYLTRMSNLEAANLGVTFIYMTSNAQGAIANRYARNEQIRSYCRANGKVLYDFADLDCWYNGEHYTEGGIPVEHPHYGGDYEGTHTTAGSCTNKAGAFWWMMARIAGWDGTPGTGPSPSPSAYPLTLTPDKETFNSGYDTITIFADVQPASNFTPYIRIVPPSGDALYVTRADGVVGRQEPYMWGPLTLGSALSGYMAATVEFSNAAPGKYLLQGALVGSGGIIGGIDSTDLTVE